MIDDLDGWAYEHKEEYQKAIDEYNEAKRAAREKVEGGKNIAEREVNNVIVDSRKEKLPQNKEEALATIPEGGKVFTNEDQNKEVRVSRKSLRHSSLHNEGHIYKAFGKIGELIKNAVKIGESPVSADEEGKTQSVGVYYVPVNIDGTQYSARMIIKELINNDMILDELLLYNVSMHKEKTPSNTNVGTSNDGLVYSDSVNVEQAKSSTSTTNSNDYDDNVQPVSRYKIKDLIHSTQENDQKILGITDKSALSFRTSKELDGENGAKKGYEHSEEERNGMVERAEALGAKLGTAIRVVDDVESLQHSDPEVLEKMKKAKGWYDRVSGRVTIVPGNIDDVEDAVATVMHEVVGHKGMRELVGKENYDRFLDAVYGHLTDELKREIDERVGRTFIDGQLNAGGRESVPEGHYEGLRRTTKERGRRRWQRRWRGLPTRSIRT